MGALIVVGATAPTGGGTGPTIHKSSGAGDRNSSGAGDLVMRGERVGASLDAAWGRVEAAAPATDYAQTAQVQGTQVAIPAGASDVVRVGLEAVAAREQESAAVDAYATSYGRFLGAVAAGDSNAAVRQATTMKTLIDGAATVARSGAQLQATSDQLLAAELAKALAGTASSTGGSVGAGAPNAPAQISALTPELRDELAAAGAKPEEIDAMQATVRTMTPDSIRAAISLLHPPLSTTASNAGDAPAEPPDVARLDQAQHNAHLWLAAATGIANPDLAPDVAPSAAATLSAGPTVGGTAPGSATAPAVSAFPTPVPPPATGQGSDHNTRWPHPRPWWALPVFAAGAVAIYGRRLRIRGLGRAAS